MVIPDAAPWLKRRTNASPLMVRCAPRNDADAETQTAWVASLEPRIGRDAHSDGDRDVRGSRLVAVTIREFATSVVRDERLTMRD